MYDKIFSKCNSKIVRVIVSILALFILFQMIDIGNTFSAFSKINLAFVPLVFLLIIGSIGIYVLNYFVFLRRLSFLKGSTLSRSFREYIYIWSIGLFLPGKIGELGVIPLLKHKHKVPYKFGSLAVGLPKVMMVIVLLCVVFLFGIGLEQFNEWILLTGIIALILCVLFVIIWFFRKDFILQFKICAGLYDSRKELLFFVKPRQIIELILVTVIRFLLVVFSFILLFLAFVQTEDLLPTLVMALSTILLLEYRNHFWDVQLNF